VGEGAEPLAVAFSSRNAAQLSWSYNGLKTFVILPSWQYGAILTGDGSGFSVEEIQHPAMQNKNC